MSEIILAVIATAFLAPVIKPVVIILAIHHKINQSNYLISKNLVLQVLFHVAM